MKIKKVEPDAFGTEYSAMDNCYDCGHVIGPDEDYWESTKIMELKESGETVKVNIAWCFPCSERRRTGEVQ